MCVRRTADAYVRNRGPHSRGQQPDTAIARFGDERFAAAGPHCQPRWPAKDKLLLKGYNCHRDKQFIVTSLGIPTGVRIVHKLQGSCTHVHLGNSYDRSGGALHALRRRAARGG